MFSPSRDRRAVIAAVESVRTSIHRAIEPLESRTLLAASIDDDTLVVAGTNGNDRITLAPDGGQIVVTINGDDESFDADDFRFIRVKGRDGRDTIRIDTSDANIAKRILILGGDGADEIHGGNTRDTVKGGNGDDLIFGNGGDDILRGGADDDIAYGGSGEDTLRGDAGADTLGGDREDRLNFLNPGSTTSDIPVNKGFNDRLDGGDGDDWLLGGWETDYDPQFTEGGVDPKAWNPGDNGSDRMTGGAGNDVIDARGRDDTITDLNEAEDLVPIDRYVNFVPNPEEFEDDDYAYHNHAQMEILVDGDNIEMPRGIGDWADVDNDLYPLFHKHWDPENQDIQLHQIHMHSVDPTPFTGRDVFQAWGVSFSNRHVGEYRIEDGDDSLEAEVNGETMSMAEFADYEIQDGDEIVIRFDTND